jgi:hypothetical protein
MAERHFNPQSRFNKDPPQPQQAVINLDQMIQFHAYFDSVKEPSPAINAIKSILEAQLHTIFKTFSTTPPGEPIQ